MFMAATSRCVESCIWRNAIALVKLMASLTSFAAAIVAVSSIRLRLGGGVTPASVGGLGLRRDVNVNGASSVQCVGLGFRRVFLQMIHVFPPRLLHNCFPPALRLHPFRFQPPSRGPALSPPADLPCCPTRPNPAASRHSTDLAARRSLCPAAAHRGPALPCRPAAALSCRRPVAALPYPAIQPQPCPAAALSRPCAAADASQPCPSATLVAALLYRRQVVALLCCRPSRGPDLIANCGPALHPPL
ncbi:unnamed protein product, partial [Closterium sp. NIES-54]